MLQKKGKIWYVVLNYKENGKWKKKWISTGEVSARAARAVEKDLEYRASAGLIKVQAEKAVATLASHFDRYLDLCVKPPSRKPSTYENYRYVRNRVCRLLGDKKLDRITSEDIDAYIKAELEAGISHTLIRLEYRVMRLAFQAAVKWKLLVVNPCDAVTPPAPVKYEAHVATMEEVQKLLETAGACAIPIREVVVCLGALCGLRRGEMCALEWKDVDMDEGSITVRHTMARRYNEDIKDGHYYKVFRGSKKTSLVIDDAKTEASAGKIYIPSLAVDALRRMYLWQQRNRMLLGMCYTDNGLVLCHEDGHPCAPNWIYQEFEELLKETGLPHLRVHDLRHTAATLLLEQGVDIKLVSRQLRHSDTVITQNLYQHVTDRLARTSADAMDALFDKKEKAK